MLQAYNFLIFCYNFIMRFRFSAILLSAAVLIFSGRAEALRLDIMADTEMRGAAYSGIIYGGSTFNHAFLSENTRFGLAVSGIEIENLPDAYADINLSFQSIAGLSAENLWENPWLAQPQESFPATDGIPYIREAYVKLGSLFSRDISAVFGRQDFSLGQGISLGSDNSGFAGALIKADNLFWGYGIELFYFNPSRYDLNISTPDGYTLRKQERKYHVYGAALDNKTPDGRWQLYHFIQHSGNLSINGGADPDINSENRTFTGIRYEMKKNHISFDGEIVRQGGSADTAGGGSIDYSGYAFMIKGSWEQGIYIFDNVKLRMGYGRSSAARENDSENTCFYADSGRRYDGLSRSGYGALAGFSLYDMQKSSATVSGLPDGLSGISVVNGGLDIPYRKIMFSADYFKFKADSAAVSRVTVADEIDIRVSVPLGKTFDFSMLYAYLKPGEVFGEDVKATSLAWFLVKAGF